MKRLFMSALIWLALAGLPILIPAAKEPPLRLGSLKGIVRDQATRIAVPGVQVILEPGNMQAISDEDGKFSLEGVVVGSYRLHFNLTGMMPLTISDQVVRPKRITFCEALLDMQPLAKNEVTIQGSYFLKNEEAPAAVTHFASEEIRRTAGAAADISRILTALPSVAKVSDSANALIVRGGNPSENTSYIDNIEVPNINHFSRMGGSNGNINLINVDFIQDVEFHAGGFSPIFGNRLSSVMNIQFREGNREETDLQIGISMLGANAIGEGPLGSFGSWLFSAQRSYLDLFMESLGTTAVPRYQDYQSKITLDLNDNHRLTLIGIYGQDSISPIKEKAVEVGQPYYGRFASAQMVAGVNWSASWGSVGFTDTSVSQIRYTYEMNMNDILSDRLEFVDDTREIQWTLRSITHLQFGEGHRLQVGGEWKRFDNRYQFSMNELLSETGQIRPQISHQQSADRQLWSGFVNYSLRAIAGLNLNLGGRYDYDSTSKRGTISPRLSSEIALGKGWAVTANAGTFYQTLPLALLIQHPENNTLQSPRVLQFGLGLKAQLSEALQASLELFDKEYDHLPMDPSDPSRLLLDTTFYDGSGMYVQRPPLSDQGKAFARGIEFVLQKKLKDKFYGMLAGGYSITRYCDLNGVWHDRIFDNRWSVSLQGGYKPSSNWEFGLRWIFSGGIPFTPFDLERSQFENSGILDMNRINGQRFANYNNLNLRSERRFHFSGSNLVIGLEIMNVFNRQNPSNNFWNKTKNEADIEYQWTIMPVFGMEWEF